jgi:hypothetical protein
MKAQISYKLLEALSSPLYFLATFSFKAGVFKEGIF